MKNMRKLLAALLAALMLASMLPVSLAAEVVDSGVFNDVSWKLDSDGVLSITGTGAIMTGDGQVYPWQKYAGQTVKIVIGDGITVIGEGAFNGFNRVTEAVLGDTVEVIGAEAFYRCTSMNTVNLPVSLRTIGREAFWGSGITSLDLPGGVESIGIAAFGDCGKLKGAVTLPQGLTRIVERTFEYCEGITGFVLPDTLEEIGNSAFFRCTGLTAIDLPEGLKTIERAAFSSCRHLESVTFPSSVTLIDGGAFDSCFRLTEIVFTGDAPVIGEDAFLNVTADVFIPENNDTWTEDKILLYGGELTWYYYDPDYVPSVIDSGAIGDVMWDYFDDGVLDIYGTGEIPDYTEANPAPWAKYSEDTYVVYIDEGITAVGENAFTGFSVLEEIYFLGAAPRIASNAFTGVTADAMFFIYEEGWTKTAYSGGYGGNLFWVYMYVIGDVYPDGQLNNADLVMMARYIVGLYDEESSEYFVISYFGDMDGDGEVTNSDVVTLARKIVGLK